MARAGKSIDVHLAAIRPLAQAARTELPKHSPPEAPALSRAARASCVAVGRGLRFRASGGDKSCQAAKLGASRPPAAAPRAGAAEPQARPKNSGPAHNLIRSVARGAYTWPTPSPFGIKSIRTPRWRRQ